MRLAPVLACAAAATATPPRGFLLVATNLPVQLLQRDADVDWRRDELGCVGPSTWPRPGSRRCASIRRRTATTRCRCGRFCGGIGTYYMIYQQQHNVEGARGGRAATPAPTYCGTTTARSARSTSRRGRRRAATTRRRTNWSCGTTSTTATLPRLLRRRRRGNFLSITLRKSAASGCKTLASKQPRT